MVAAIVALSLVSTASGQSTTPPPTHHAKAKAKTSSNSNVAQPDSGAPPEQAVQPDASAPLTQTPNYDPPPPPPRPPDPEPAAAPPVAPAPAPAPAPVQETPAMAMPVVEKTEAPPPPPAPLRPMTEQEQQLEKDSARLLTLVRELKDEVAKAGIDTLSLNALRKAQEIERLSKTLKDRLKAQALTGTNQTPAGAQ
jgi:outer membrane biosynthesis protein TonB